MNLIVNVSEDWGIGYKNDLLFPIPEDMKFFRDTTKDKIVVMGHNTLKSLPGGNPLKNRINIVLSRKKDLTIPGALVYNSLESLLEALKSYNSSDIFVIGGENIYRQLLDYCDVAYVTRVRALKQADSYFPNLDTLDNWDASDISDEREHEGLKYVFYTYKNKNK